MSELLRRLYWLFHRRKLEREMTEEMEVHRERMGERAGQFGSGLRLMEEAREAWGWIWLDRFFQDVHFGVRQLIRTPGFTFAAIATLALGIGANTAIFSVVSGVLLRPLPFSQPEDLVELFETQPGDRTSTGFSGPVVYRDFAEWRTHSKLFEGMATYTRSGRNLQGAGDPEQVATVLAERGLFDLLGAKALGGRTFRENDPPNVVVASYGFWKAHFGESDAAIGRNLVLDGEKFTLIGVMPKEFQFPYVSSSIGLWFPWELPADLRNNPNRRLDAVVARLKHGVPMEAARQELASMEGPSQAGRKVAIRSLREIVSGGARDALLVLSGIVLMVLLVACVNVANLLLARTASREREIAIRTALGAGRLRLVRQFLTESLLLALGGGLAGVAMGWWGQRVLVSVAAGQIPRAEEIGMDWRVFAALLAACVVSGVGFGLAPAMAAARGESVTLKSRGVRLALRDCLVIVEVASSFVLLAGAGLLLRSFLNLQRTNVGVQSENVLTAHVVLGDGKESMALEERVGRIPGVQAAGLISLLPLQNSGWAGGITIPGRVVLEIELRYVTPGYFRAMGIPLQRGREFSTQDGPKSARVILINETLARQYLRGEDPVGRGTNRGTIIGVVGDVRQETLHDPPKPEVYYTVAQNFGQLRRNGSTLVVRSQGSPDALVRAIRGAVQEVSPGQALFRVGTMQEVIDESLADPRFFAWLVGLFAAVGTLLAIAGIYGVIAYLVAQQTREYGIRMALGADASRVLQGVMRRGGLLIGLGLAIGIAGAAALTKVLQGFLYGVTSTDPVVFCTMAAILAVAALGACLVPALRAARVNPSVALRCE